nr:septal ring lytic transglycosylase RlpA family protein [Catelliglobosispora koreensis]
MALTTVGQMSSRRTYGAAAIASVILAGGTYLALAGRHDETPLETAAAPSASPSTAVTPEPTFERPPPPVSREMERKAPSVTQAGSCGASFYHEPQGTANGEIFDPEAMTAAHKTLPFNSKVRVTNPDNGKSVTVRINDRGPYIDGRCLDLSRAAFREIANLSQGVLDLVTYEVLAP